MQTPQTNMQTFGQGQIQNPIQTPQEVPVQIQPTSQQQLAQVTPNCQTTNNPTFGQNQGQIQEMSQESLNAINNYPNSNPQI